MTKSRVLSGLPIDGALAASLGFALVVLPGAGSGWYDDTRWTTASVALGGLAVTRALIAQRVTMGPLERLMIGALVMLALLVAFSSAWGVRGSEPVLETRRAVLYVAALVALVLCVAQGSARRLLEGAAAGAAVLATWGLVSRIFHPHPPSDPFEGTLLTTPVGYANALGVVAAMGALTAVGLSATAEPACASRAWRAAASVLVSALVMTESRGAALALAAGAVVAVLVAPPLLRGRLAAAAAAASAPTALAVVLVPRTSGVALAAVIVGAAALAAAIAPVPIDRRALVVAVVAVGAAGMIAFVVLLSSGGSSYRTDYWQVAVDTAWDHAPLGSGAGSFDDEWLQRRPVPVNVRDAHSLYLETVAELGVAGLFLVGVLAAVPFVGAARFRHDAVVPVAAGAYAAFLVHAGIDWDWEMPVVTLSALVAASAILAVARPAPSANATAER